MLQGLLVMLFLVGKTEAMHPVETFHIAAHLTLLGTIADTVESCNEGTDAIRGCTHIVGEVLSTNCSEHRGGWSLEVRGYAQARIRVTYPRLIIHELQHVRDISEAANALTAGAAATPFASKEACEAAAVSFREHFRDDLQKVARQSNEKRR